MAWPGEEACGESRPTKLTAPMEETATPTAQAA